MPAPKKPRPPVELDAAAIDDGWSLPPEIDLPKPEPTSATPRHEAAAKAEPVRKARKRLEDWFDEVDLGWVLPDDEQPLGPPAPEEVVAGPEDLDAYEEIEVSADVEPEPVEVVATEPEPVHIEAAEPEPVHVEAAEPEPVHVEAAEPDEPELADDRLDLNTATVEDFVALPGVGPKKAQAIVAWRDQHERFATVADLARVNGFGEKSVAKLADRLVVRTAQAD